MKLYIWKHNGYAVRQTNFYPLSKSEQLKKGSFRGLAVHAFFRRKDAIKHLEESGWDKWTRDRYELVTVEVVE